MMFPLRKGPLPDVTGNLYGWQITSYFGGRIDPLTGRKGTHGGMDLAFYGCTGQPMIAVKSGLLSQGWDSSGGGNWSSLYCDDGDYFGYGHASSFAFTGGGSRWVEAGTIIAYVGTTGGSTGPHLHFAYRPKGANGYRDPYDLLVDAAAGQRPPTPPAPPVVNKPTPPKSEEDDDMLKAPRTSWKNKSGAWFALTPDGRFSYIDGEQTLNALRTPHEGHPAEIGEPIEIADGVEKELAKFYNA